MAISDRLNKLTTDITNAYTSIENKGGTTPANKNTNNLSTAINSIEVIETATAEGESISLTNTKAMPYSDYVVKGKSEQDGEPSPSNPSEIHSVADDVNLFDASKINNPTAITVSNNGETITMPIASSGNGAASTNATLKQLCPDLQVGDYIYLNFTRNLGKTYNNLIYLAGSGKEIYNASAYSFNTGTTITQQDLDSTVYLYGNRYSSGETQQCIITDFKIQKNKITPYSPYNQGTVTIKQRGKNLLNVESIFTLKGSKTIDLDLEVGSYTLSLSNWSTTGANAMSQITFNYIDGTTLNVTIWAATRISSLTFTKKVTSVKIFSNTTDANSGAITTTYTNLMLEKGSQATDYESYQTPHDYTIQTEPLRSLPNGVKDTIEADGIHRRVGVKVFTGDSNTEGWSLNNFPNQIDTMCAQISFSKSVSKQNENGLLCDKLKKKILYSLDEEGIDCYTTGGGFVIRINRDRLSSEDLAGLRAYLQSNPITVQYELAEETIEPLTQNQATTMLDIIKTGSYEGTTNIYTDEDVKPTIEVEYYKKG